MKATTTILALLLLALFIGCGGKEAVGPTQDQSGSLAGVVTNGPSGQGGGQPKFYSFSETDDWNEGFMNLIKIDTRTGSASTLWHIGVYNTPTEIVTPFGLTFDVDGTMYAFVSWCDFIPGHQRSRLASVDMQTGAVKFIGPDIPLHFAGPDIDANGNLYVTGFTVGPPETGNEPAWFFGDDVLYRVNKVTGVPTPIGHTGRTDWMDLAFDSHGTLWATTRNKLYQLNTQNGTATFIVDITGVPNEYVPGVGIPPEDWPWLEPMTIAFDENDVLWATAIKGFSNSFGNGIVLRIDTNTGKATFVGYTNKPYNHGGDIMPSKVRVCHKTGNGKYNTITIDMDALPAHLAHGDIVPGAAGNDCNCP